MTDSQATQLAKSPATKKALAVLTKFAQAEADFKELDAQRKEAEAQLMEAMESHGINKISGDWGYITKAVRKSFKVIADEVPAEFAKLALDTKKVAAHVTLTGEMPAGVEQNETQYLTKKISL